MEGSYLFISDVHSNWPALRAVLKDARRWTERYGEFTGKVCLGDTVGYGPYARKCVRRVRGEGFLSIAGNHDVAVVEDGCSHFNSDAKEAVELNIEDLKGERRQNCMTYLKGLSPKPVFDPRGRFGFVHGSFTGLSRFGEIIVPVDYGYEGQYITDPDEAIFAMHAMKVKTDTGTVHVPIGFVGHTHIPLHTAYRTRYVDGKPAEVDKESLTLRYYLAENYTNGMGPVFDIVPSREGGWITQHIINFGSVGQPRNESPHACYGIAIFRGDGSVNIQFRSVAYPVEETQRKMIEQGFPEDSVSRLECGR